MTVMALRDASWWPHPDVHAPKVYHSVVSPPYAAACNATRMVLATNTEQPVSAVPVGLRCQRRACKNLWAAESVSSRAAKEDE